jgi:adenylate cyclase
MSDQSADTKMLLGVYENHRQVACFPLERITEIGRQQANEPPPYKRIALDGMDRIIIADLAETTVSRKHLRFEPVQDGKVKVVNESVKNSVALLGDIRLEPGKSLSLELPIACEFGNKLVRIYSAPRESLNLQSLQSAAFAPGLSTRSPAQLRSLMPALVDGGSAKASEQFLVDWLEASMDVFQSAAASIEFLPKAARAALELVNLDIAAVLLYQNGNWSLTAKESRAGECEQEQWAASQTMLRRVLEARRTFFHVPSQDSKVAASLLNVQSFVAAPFLNRSGEVLGVLYGERRADSALRPPIREIDAKLIELLAYGVASGLARMEQERQLIAERVRFEQFFTPELARVLEVRGDEMLAARDAEITVLFCDIKGFSRISAACGAALAVEWVCDVLSELSDCVAEYQGVLVDYSGDALEAMWGAPLATEKHATLACRAALSMRATLASINERWEQRLGEATDISIGIHSGAAQVGNIGSRRKYKYGALGTTVNLTSRIQGATKYVGQSVLVSQATIQKADPAFAFRRLCTIRTVNIIEPVTLYELCEDPNSDWSALTQAYELALQHFEAQRFEEAEAALKNLLVDYPQDIPTRRLSERLSQVDRPVDRPSRAFDSIWTLDGK